MVARKPALVVVCILAVVVVSSCHQVNSGTVSISNSLSAPIRIKFDQNYEHELITMNPGQTIERDYEYYHEVLFPDELPRARYTRDGSHYTIIPMERQNKTFYVTNTTSSAVTVYNSLESDSSDYPVPVDAVNVPIAFSYYQHYSFSLRDVNTEDYTIQVATEDVIISGKAEKRVYVLVRPRGVAYAAKDVTIM
mgnify:CR=1 FL=1